MTIVPLLFPTLWKGYFHPLPLCRFNLFDICCTSNQLTTAISLFDISPDFWAVAILYTTEIVTLYIYILIQNKPHIFR